MIKARQVFSLRYLRLLLTTVTQVQSISVLTIVKMPFKVTSHICHIKSTQVLIYFKTDSSKIEIITGFHLSLLTISRWVNIDYQFCFNIGFWWFFSSFPPIPCFKYSRSFSLLSRMSCFNLFSAKTRVKWSLYSLYLLQTLVQPCWKKG